jgi:hypothetical protein
MEREKKLSILYQKQGRATQFSSESARDKWLQKEIDDLECVLSSNTTQASIHLTAQVIHWPVNSFSIKFISINRNHISEVHRIYIFLHNGFLLLPLSLIIRPSRNICFSLKI